MLKQMLFFAAVLLVLAPCGMAAAMGSNPPACEMPPWLQGKTGWERMIRE